MKLAFSTNAYVNFPVLDAVERIAAAGYDGVELLADVPHLYPPEVTESHIRRLREVLDRTGLAVSNINANTAAGFYGKMFWEPVFEPSLAHPDESLRRWRVGVIQRCIGWATEIGAPCVSITSGRMVPGVEPERSLEFLRGSLQELLRAAEDSGIRIGMEYEPGLLVECCDELAALADEINSPLFGANLDWGHSHVLGEDPDAVAERLGSRIVHVHVEDIRGRKHYHLIPGLGDVDFGLLWRAMKKAGYDGFATVELYTYPHRPDEAAVQSLSALRSLTGSADNLKDWPGP